MSTLLIGLRSILAWFWIIFPSYVILAAFVYIPLFSFAAPSDYGEIPGVFWAEFWSAIAVHHALALGVWQFAGRKFGMNLPAAASATCLMILGTTTTLFFLFMFALASLAIE